MEREQIPSAVGMGLAAIGAGLAAISLLTSTELDVQSRLFGETGTIMDLGATNQEVAVGLLCTNIFLFLVNASLYRRNR
jgi:hypothetical protein